MACFTGTTCVIENIAMSGLDFIYLDLEHTNFMLDEAFEKQIMAMSSMTFHSGPDGGRQ